MLNNKKKIQRLTLAAFFVAIELIMGFTPIGYIPVGALNITTMHLPVILAGIIAGPAFGAGMGFVFRFDILSACNTCPESDLICILAVYHCRRNSGQLLQPDHLLCAADHAWLAVWNDVFFLS